LIFRIGNLSAGICSPFLWLQRGQHTEPWLSVTQRLLGSFSPSGFSFQTIPATDSDGPRKSGRLQIGISGRFASE
jgi:hypothetical protein